MEHKDVDSSSGADFKAREKRNIRPTERMQAWKGVSKPPQRASSGSSSSQVAPVAEDDAGTAHKRARDDSAQQLPPKRSQKQHAAPGTGLIPAPAHHLPALMEGNATKQQKIPTGAPDGINSNSHDLQKQHTGVTNPKRMPESPPVQAGMQASTAAMFTVANLAAAASPEPAHDHQDEPAPKRQARSLPEASEAGAPQAASPSHRASQSPGASTSKAAQAGPGGAAAAPTAAVAQPLASIPPLGVPAVGPVALYHAPVGQNGSPTPAAHVLGSTQAATNATPKKPAKKSKPSKALKCVRRHRKSGKTPQRAE